MNLATIKPMFGATGATCGVLDNVLGKNLCNTTDLNTFISLVASIIVSLLGLVLTIVILYCAIEIITSGGSSERIKSAKNRLTQAAVSLGLLISFSAIIGLLGIPTTPGGPGGVNSLFAGVDTSTFDGVEKLITNAIQILMIAIGSFSVIFIIVGGIQYIIAAGGSGVETAKKTITYAVSGLLLALSTTAIIQLINRLFFS